MKEYQNTALPAEERAKLLLAEMTLEEKIFQLKSQLLWPQEIEEKRDYRTGAVRNIGHFLHEHGAVKPSVAAQAINEDTRKSIQAGRLGIPVLQNGEALHGAEWCNGTLFPQSLGMGAAFDEELTEEVALAVGKELRAGGVRQVFAPVVNVTRDCRWGRTEEGYGEDVLLNARMGAAFCRGLEANNVIATPKHYVDNYGDGGRDSASSLNSWRTLYEVYLEPFRACFQEGGARSVMAAYNTVDGVPCSCSEELLTKILRDEWGFDGFVVSDYGGVEGSCYSHGVARDLADAAALCLKAGLDADMPNGGTAIREAYDRGLISMEDIDRSVLRILKQKFLLGLFEEPFVDAQKADGIVRCPEHRSLAKKAACETMVLLKNNGLLPLQKGKYKRIGVFGPAMDCVNSGDYSGPYGGWHGDAKTPIEALKEYLGDEAELVVCADESKLSETAAGCDLNLFFTAAIEGEGTDRSSLKLPGARKALNVSTECAVIIGTELQQVEMDQEGALGILAELEVPLCVVLTGTPVDVTGWCEGADAILEAWYPGEEGSQAIAETLFGENNPGGKLPISFPRSVGQLPLYYAYKTMGRGINYVENDGSPLYEFGYGLSYTDFRLDDFNVEACGRDGASVSLNVTNIGNRAGDEVVQLYVSVTHAEVCRPTCELKAFKRVSLQPGETQRILLTADKRALSFYDRKMNFGIHPCSVKIGIGTSCKKIAFEHSFEIENE